MNVRDGRENSEFVLDASSEVVHVAKLTRSAAALAEDAGDADAHHAGQRVTVIFVPCAKELQDPREQLSWG